MLVSYKKKFFQKFISILVFICLIISNFAGCGSQEKDWVKQYKKHNITFSEFLLVTTLKVRDVEMAVRRRTKSYDELTFEDLKEGNVRGTPALEYLKNIVDEDLNKIIVNNVVAEKLKVKFNEQEKKALKNNGYSTFKSLCDSFNAHKIGISLQDCMRFIYWQGLDYKIGEAIYGKGKFGEVKDENIKKFVNNRNNVVKYSIITIPKSLQNEKVEKEVKKGDKKEIKKTNELKIKKQYKLDKTKDLVNLLFEQIKKGEKSFEDVEKELRENFKNSPVSLKEDLKFFDDKYDDDLKNAYDEKKRKIERKIKNSLKDMKKDNVCRMFEEENEFYILKTVPMDDNLEDQKKEKVKTILQEKAKRDYVGKIEKEIKKKIETNDSTLKQSNINKQVKKVYGNKKEKRDFGIPEM